MEKNIINYSLYFLFFISVSCQHSEKEKNVFYYNEENGISSLDPAFARDQSNIWAVSQIFNGLVQFNDSLKVVPCIAKSWEISDSGKTYTFHLRNDIYFHNDISNENKKTKLTAHDVAYSFYRLVHPHTASPGAWIFNDKFDFNFSEINLNNIPTGKVFSFENDSTFTIHLAQTFTPLLSLLCMPYCYIVSEKAVIYYREKFRSHPIGTGAFQLKMWHEGVKLIMKKNNNYFEYDENNNRLPYLNGVVISFTESKQASFFYLVRNKIDFMNGLESSFKDEILSHNGTLKKAYADKFSIEINPYLNTEYMGFIIDSNVEVMKGSPLLDLNFRKAIAYAIDRKKMISYLRNNIGNYNVKGFIPDGIAGQSEKNYYTYNLKLARKLLNDAGWGTKKKIPFIKLFTTKNYSDLTIFIQHSLQEIGIHSTIDVNPGAVHRKMVSQSKLPCFRGSWLADYADAENYLSLFYSKNAAPNGPGNFHMIDKIFDTLYISAMKETDEQKRNRLYKKMDNRVMEICPAIVLFYDRSVHLLSKSIVKMKTNSMNIPDLKRVIKQ